MSYVIEGLEPAPFRPLFALSDEALAERLARRVVCEESPGSPCRVSLMDAAVGETLILAHWTHQPAATPYRASHAVFVREAAVRMVAGAGVARFVGEVPLVLSRRLLSVRAYDAEGMMLDAEVVDGTGLDTLIRRWLQRPEVAMLHAHNAAPGCFAAAIVREG